MDLDAWKKETSTIVQRECEACIDYTGDWYEIINTGLRNKRLSKHAGEKVAQISETFAKVPDIPTGLVIYRGRTSMDMSTIAVGSIITNMGFSSFSLNEQVARSFGNQVTVLRIPPGIKGLFLSGDFGTSNIGDTQGYEKSEDEVLLDIGLQLEVTKIEHSVEEGSQNPIDVYRIHVDLVGFINIDIPSIIDMSIDVNFQELRRRLSQMDVVVHGITSFGESKLYLHTTYNLTLEISIILADMLGWDYAAPIRFDSPIDWYYLDSSNFPTEYRMYSDYILGGLKIEQINGGMSEFIEYITNFDKVNVEINGEDVVTSTLTGEDALWSLIKGKMKGWFNGTTYYPLFLTPYPISF